MQSRPMTIPAMIDSVGKPGIPVPFGGIGVITDDAVVVTEVVLLTVTRLVVVEVYDDTKKVVEVDSVDTNVLVEVTPVTPDDPPAGANSMTVERSFVAARMGVVNPGDAPTIQPLLGEVM
jgi:hypothetical protein